MAGVEGLEPPTSGFGDRRSSQLSYTPASPARLPAAYKMAAKTPHCTQPRGRRKDGVPPQLSSPGMTQGSLPR